MSNSSFQIIYETEETNRDVVSWLWKEEAMAMDVAGINVSTIPSESCKTLMFRGGSSQVKNIYNSDNRYINQYRHFIDYNFMSHYLPYISNLSIDTFFSEELDEKVIEKISELGWQKAFIRKDVKSLEHVDEYKSVYPLTSLEEMKKLYEDAGFEGKYAIRKFIERDTIDQEERYWVLNGNIYHRNNAIPNVVKEAVKRLNKLGSRYYTVDATPEFVVEVNPGESSDRHAVNPAELFASWIKKEFA